MIHHIRYVLHTLFVHWLAIILYQKFISKYCFYYYYDYCYCLLLLLIWWIDVIGVCGVRYTEHTYDSTHYNADGVVCEKKAIELIIILFLSKEERCLINDCWIDVTQTSSIDFIYSFYLNFLYLFSMSRFRLLWNNSYLLIDKQFIIFIAQPANSSSAIIFLVRLFHHP